MVSSEPVLSNSSARRTTPSPSSFIPALTLKLSGASGSRLQLREAEIFGAWKGCRGGVFLLTGRARPFSITAMPDTAEIHVGKEEFAEFFLRSKKSSSNFGFFGMAAKNVDALEERLEGEMNQIKETVEERMSSMEGQVADLRDMMKKMLEFQTQSATSDAKGPEAKNTNSEIHREEEEVEIVEGRRGRPHLEPFQREERGGGYGERQGYGGMEPRGAGGEH
ncbi:hypothetical protein M5K25_022650 [Dendrobium thyrsiflorum]|uniref:Uncharacterized protein n=1 Tax=Dendrobium thyrsiflorum TaxID=117978 RepID=A0ABD0U6N1_DENTH